VGHFRGACGNYKWRDHRARCVIRPADMGDEPDSEGDSDDPDLRSDDPDLRPDDKPAQVRDDRRHMRPLPWGPPRGLGNPICI
jgi:hypothetical protein